MKLIPNKHQLKKLSSDEQAYWNGYFQGMADEAVRASRLIQTTNENMSVGQLAEMVRHMPSEQRDLEIRKFIQRRKVRRAAVAETGGTDYAA